MLQSLRTNPVYVHLTRNRRWPSPRAAWIISGGIALIGAVIATASMLYDYAMDRTVGSLVAVVLTFGGQAVALLSVPIAGVVTALVTAHTAESEMHDLLRVAPLEPRTIVTGYLLAALFRLRLLWALAFGLALPVVISFSHLLVWVAAWIPCLDGPCADPSYERALATAASAVGGWVLAGVAFNWLAACSGVVTALRFRRPRAAIGATLGIVLLFGILTGGVTWAIATSIWLLWVVWPVLALALLVALALGTVMLRWAEREV